ncbi:MAG: hypothetical protein FWE03_07190 [Firmicutes bacterium]|nr:hypothetical protein [Bacillota bacterium]
MKRCCILGQKRLCDDEQDKVYEAVFEQIDKLIEQGYDEFIFGKDGDFNSLSHTAVLVSKMKWSFDIKRMYYTKHNKDTKTLYQIYDAVVAVKDKLHEVMIDNADFCIFYARNNVGELKKAMEYAIAKGKVFINLARTEV